MGMAAAVRIRIAQQFVRLGRGLHPAGKQALEIGPGAVFSLGQLMRDKRLRKPLVVVGAGETAALYKLQHALENEDIPFEVFDKVPELPLPADGAAIAAAYAAGEHDSVIAAGDGPLLDIVKAAAASVGKHGRDIAALAGRRVSGRKAPPIVAIPTAAGSGAEAMGLAAVADGKGGYLFLEGEALLPAAALSDPEMMADTPREKLADAGMSGLCWAVEAYLAAPMSDTHTRTQAAEAAELFFASLESCWNSGGTLRERSDVLSASRLAGRAATAAGGGYARALVRAAQSVCGVRFADACGVILPAVLEKYGSQAHNGLAQLAVLADVAEEGTRQDRAQVLIDRIRALAFRMGLPEELDMSAEQAARVADMAAARANPRYISPVVWTAEDCHDLILSLRAKQEKEI